MTDRERWTVYPLLFLALGISLKDKLTRTVETDRVQCKTLVCEALEVGGPEPGQRVTIMQGHILCRSLVATDETGKLQLAAVSSNQDGGILRTYGTHTGTHAVLGNFKQYAGLLFVDARGGAHAGPMYGSPVPLQPAKPQDKPAGGEQSGGEQSSGGQSPPAPEAQEPAAGATGSDREPNAAEAQGAP